MMIKPSAFSNQFSAFFVLIVWLPTVAYCVLIFYLSSQEITIKVDLFPMEDKIIHFIEYGVLSALVFFSLRKSIPGFNVKTVAALAIVFSGLYGISDEVHQYFVPGRDSSVGDVIADFTGAAVFQGINVLKLKRSL